jgi:hypothetical protein
LIDLSTTDDLDAIRSVVRAVAHDQVAPHARAAEVESRRA